MKKNDITYLILSCIINFIIIFLISYKNIDLDDEHKVKIGLVSYENKSTTKLPSKENSNSNNKNEELTESLKEKIKENKINEKSENIKKPTLEDLKKLIDTSKPQNNNILIKGEDKNTDRILANIETNGLQSGSIFGDVDGDISIEWNENNKKPIFPESAELSGKNGKLIILIKVDKFGNIIFYNIEKGSGVIEIDTSLEKVINTWKIKLKKKDKNIEGSFYLHYNFNFKNN